MLSVRTLTPACHIRHETLDQCDAAHRCCGSLLSVKTYYNYLLLSSMMHFRVSASVAGTVQ
jgi:hypothetical protein